VLNNNNFQRHIDPQARCLSETSGRFKKACPEPFEGFVQSCPESCRREGRSHFCAQSVLPVREHGKMTRTPLAAFFSSPLMCIKIKAGNLGIFFRVPAGSDVVCRGWEKRRETNRKSTRKLIAQGPYERLIRFIFSWLRVTVVPVFERHLQIQIPIHFYASSLLRCQP
jgi:hypothetical protein